MYIDDLCPVADSYNSCWKIGHATACGYGWYWDERNGEWMELGGDQRHPETVALVPSLRQNVDSLVHIMSSEQPPVHAMCTKKIAIVNYGFGDALAVGFGSTLQLPVGCTFFRHVLWGRDADDVSSNFRELSNLVETLEEGLQS